MIGWLKRLLFRPYGFFRKPAETYPANPDWASAAFFEAHKSKAQFRSLRLAEIARERDSLKEKLAKAIRDKKARQPIYKALRALTNEEMALERGQ